MTVAVFTEHGEVFVHRGDLWAVPAPECATALGRVVWQSERAPLSREGEPVMHLLSAALDLHPIRTA